MGICAFEVVPICIGRFYLHIYKYNIYLYQSYHLGTLSKVLASIKTTSNCRTDFPSSSHMPIPASTKVLLDHIEIDIKNKEILIFCKVIDDKWMVENMVKWKGYTFIAVTGLPGSPTANQGWRFKGTGKMSILDKNVCSYKVFATYTFGLL